MSLNRFGNGKISGLAAACWYAAAALCRCIGRRFVSPLQCSRLGRHGRNCRIGRNVTIRYPGKIGFGDGVCIADEVFLTADTAEGRCEIGDHVNVDRMVRLDFTGDLRIGSGVTISEMAVIETHTHGYDPHSTPRPCKLEIGRNVWIGMRAVILPQVGSIGDNAVVGAGAVVTKAVPPNTVVAGNPARIIKTFSHER